METTESLLGTGHVLTYNVESGSGILITKFRDENRRVVGVPCGAIAHDIAPGHVCLNATKECAKVFQLEPLSR